MNRELLFGPWGLGDAIIAAAVARLRPERFAICCAPQHRLFLEAGFDDASSPKLLTASLSYTNRAQRSYFHRGAKIEAIHTDLQLECVRSIRGDVRDLLAARKFFPGVPVAVAGWTPFFARHSALFDALLDVLGTEIASRYRLWTDACHIAFAELEEDYARRSQAAPTNARVLINVGAQWLSRQFPHIAELTRMLRRDFEVLIVRGPADQLPAGMTEDEVALMGQSALVDAIRGSALVIANDSGPMHLASYLGRRVLAIGRVSNIYEWLPPHADVVVSEEMPRRYRAHGSYATDEVISGWPSAGDVHAKVLEIMSTIRARSARSTTDSPLR